MLVVCSTWDLRGMRFEELTTVFAVFITNGEKTVSSRLNLRYLRRTYLYNSVSKNLVNESKVKAVDEVF